jgi:hypothetical protein
MDGSGVLSSRTLNRALPWIAGAVLLFGIFAFWQTRVNTSDEPETFSNQPATDVAAEKTVPLPPEARQIAVKFMKTAVVRKNLREAKVRARAGSSTTGRRTRRRRFRAPRSRAKAPKRRRIL